MNDQFPDLQAAAVKSLYKLSTNCRMCESGDLVEYLDLGFTPPADQFRLKQELELPEISYPLKVNLCRKCGLSQLSHVVDPRVLYQYDYPYEQSTTKTGKLHWDEFAQKVVSRINAAPNSLVVDIGGNVGTLLESFRAQGMRVMGVDPAPNIVEIANANGVETICAFFGPDSAAEVEKKSGKASVIIGTNVFAHIDDLTSVMRSSSDLLDERGVFIFESPHFLNLVEHLEYDTIYHEHLSYLSLKPLIPFFARFGMEVFAIEESDIHGGSFRVYVGRQGQRPIDPSVEEIRIKEEKGRIHEVDKLNEFAARVAKNREQLVWLIEDLLHQGKSVAVVSTPAKGMTLLNYCGLTNRQIVFASEKARLKIGRFTPGGQIPIVSDEELMLRKPDYALLLAWNFSKEIMSNLKAFSDAGGHFIIPIPTPIIV